MVDLFAPIPTLAQALRSGETTATDLARIALERLDTHGRSLNAVVTLTEEQALREAALADAELAAGVDRGPLHGIPWGAKDLIAVPGYPTTWGSAPYRDQTFDEEAFVVTRLRAAGAVLVAKLAMVEIAGGMGYGQPNASFTGPCMTPWNTDGWSGGSSSGSGSAVGAGAVGFALGSETWGSIVSPAANCGVSGLRPTYGRVSRRGAMALSWTLDKLGPLAHSANDCGLILAAIAGRDPGDDTSADRPFTWNASTPAMRRSTGFRFGVLHDAGKNVQPEVAANFNASLDVLREFGTLEEVTLPDFPYNEAAGAIVQAELSSAFEDLLLSGDVQQLTAPEDRVRGLISLAIPAHVYLRAMRIRRLIARTMDEVMAPYDAIVSPTMQTVASPIDRNFEAYFSRSERSPIGAAANLSGLPGIAIPNGFGQRGLPTSLLFTGRAWDEHTVLSAATAYQQHTDWHTRQPDLSNL